MANTETNNCTENNKNNVAQALADEFASTIKTLIEVDEDDCHELSNEPRFNEQDIALAFLLGVIKSSTLSDITNPKLVGETAIKFSTQLGFFTEQED